MTNRAETLNSADKGRAESVDCLRTKEFPRLLFLHPSYADVNREIKTEQ